jgi:hypothetical protein
VAGDLSAATGREIEFVDVPSETATQGLIQAGLPAFVAEQVVAIFAQARRGLAEQVTATVETLTGRPATDFASFARAHASLFAPVAEAAPQSA